MQIVEDKISLSTLKKMSEKMFGGLVKATIDVEKEILVVDSDLHSDQESYLIQHGSKQNNIWGINLYPNADEENFIEFDSMINLRPSFGNSTRGVDDPEIRKKIKRIVLSKVDFNN